MKQYFETGSRILPNKNNEPDVSRFINRISFEAINGLEGTIQGYCKYLEAIMKNHVDIEQYEIAEGLRRAINQLKE